MFLNSLKQLFRRPGKALIFFLLMAASTALLVFAAVSMTETSQRIDAAENRFTTIATVSQNLQPGDEYLHADMLLFDGAEYVTPPETRPLLMSYNSDLYSTDEQAHYLHIMSFAVLEILDDGFVTARVERSLFDKLDVQQVSLFGTSEKDLEEGDIITVGADSADTVFEVGKTYIASCFFYFTAHNHDEPEYYNPYFRPFSTQRTADGQLSAGASDTALSMRDLMRVEEVTEDFWDKGGRGEAWESWVEAM